MSVGWQSSASDTSQNDSPEVRWSHDAYFDGSVENTIDTNSPLQISKPSLQVALPLRFRPDRLVATLNPENVTNFTAKMSVAALNWTEAIIEETGFEFGTRNIPDLVSLLLALSTVGQGAEVEGYLSDVSETTSENPEALIDLSPFLHVLSKCEAVAVGASGEGGEQVAATALCTCVMLMTEWLRLHNKRFAGLRFRPLRHSNGEFSWSGFMLNGFRDCVDTISRMRTSAAGLLPDQIVRHLFLEIVALLYPLNQQYVMPPSHFAEASDVLLFVSIELCRGLVKDRAPSGADDRLVIEHIVRTMGAAMVAMTDHSSHMVLTSSPLVEVLLYSVRYDVCKESNATLRAIVFSIDNRLTYETPTTKHDIGDSTRRRELLSALEEIGSEVTLSIERISVLQKYETVGGSSPEILSHLRLATVFQGCEQWWYIHLNTIPVSPVEVCLGLIGAYETARNAEGIGNWKVRGSTVCQNHDTLQVYLICYSVLEAESASFAFIDLYGGRIRETLRGTHIQKLLLTRCPRIAEMVGLEAS